MVDQSIKLPKYDPNKFKTKTSLSRVFKVSQAKCVQIPLNMVDGLIDENDK